MDDLRRDGVPLQHGDPFVHPVALQLLPDLRKNVLFHAQHLSVAAGQFQHGGIEHQTAAMGDPGFNNQVRLDPPNQLLHGNDILWVLNNGPPHPGEIVGIAASDGPIHPFPAELMEFCVAADFFLMPLNLLLVLLYDVHRLIPFHSIVFPIWQPFSPPEFPLSINSASSGSLASLSDRIIRSTRSSGHFTASCGSSQRMPPSDAGS